MQHRYQEIFTAIKDDDIQFIQKCDVALIKKATNEYGKRPLHVAAHYGKTELCVVLIERGADINMVLHDGTRGAFQTLPIHEAIMRDQSEPISVEHRTNVVALLCKHNTRLDCREANGKLPIHLAAQNGYLDMLKLIAGKSNIEARVQLQRSQAKGETPLLLALKNQHDEVASYLIKLGADAKATDRHGKNAFYYAAKHGLTNIVMLLKDQFKQELNPDRADDTLLHLAARYNDEKAIDQFLKLGMKIEFMNEDGNTALHIAARHLSYHAVSRLIKAKANIDACNDDQKTPLHLAINALELKKSEVIDFAFINDVAKKLILNSKDIDAKDNDGNTALHLSAIQGLIEIMKMLCVRHADVNAQNNEKQTSAHLLLCSYLDPEEIYIPSETEEFDEEDAEISEEAVLKQVDNGASPEDSSETLLDRKLANLAKTQDGLRILNEYGADFTLLDEDESSVVDSAHELDSDDYPDKPQLLSYLNRAIKKAKALQAELSQGGIEKTLIADKKPDGMGVEEDAHQSVIELFQQFLGEEAAQSEDDLEAHQADNPRNTTELEAEQIQNLISGLTQDLPSQTGHKPSVNTTPPPSGARPSTHGFFQAPNQDIAPLQGKKAPWPTTERMGELIDEKLMMAQTPSRWLRTLSIALMATGAVTALIGTAALFPAAVSYANVLLPITEQALYLAAIITTAVGGFLLLSGLGLFLADRVIQDAEKTDQANPLLSSKDCQFV